MLSAITTQRALNPLRNSHCLQQVRFATKKGGGSTSNGRDSAGRRLGIKVWPGTECRPGNIILRQRGYRFKVGENVGMGKDHTLYSKAYGTVYMTKDARKRNVVHVRAEI